MRNHNCGRHPKVRDYGAEPFIFNISHATNMNRNFRTALWTGCHMQLTPSMRDSEIIIAGEESKTSSAYSLV